MMYTLEIMYTDGMKQTFYNLNSIGLAFDGSDAKKIEDLCDKPWFDPAHGTYCVFSDDKSFCAQFRSNDVRSLYFHEQG